MKHIIIDLNNIPDHVLNKMLKDKKIKRPENKFSKIKKIVKEYSLNDAYPYVAEYLYAGQVPIEIRKCDSSEATSPLNMDFITKKLKAYLKEKYQTALEESLRPDVNEELKINKIRELASKKILIQFSTLDKIVTRIKDYDLEEMKKIKIINSVVDIEREFIQIRANLSDSKTCIDFYKDLFSPFEFEEINFNKKLVDDLKHGLGGETYEYIGKKLFEEHESPLETGVGKEKGEIKGRPVIKHKTLKKSKFVDELSTKYVEFKDEIKEYELESDFFRFLLGHNKKYFRLQLTVDRSRLYFRNFATESAIDHVLETLSNIL